MNKKNLFCLLMSFVFFISFAWADPTISVNTNNNGSIHKVHSRSKNKLVSSAIVNLNTADITLLTSLKGVGAKKAQAILDYRKQHGSFKDVHDLQNIKGFSEKTLDRILKNNTGRIVVS